MFDPSEPTDEELPAAQFVPLEELGAKESGSPMRWVTCSWTWAGSS